MNKYRLSAADLRERFTGLVVESLVVKQDFGSATVGCRRCGRRISAGAAVTVALTCYENHSWEIQGVYCRDHGVGSVNATMDVRAENQAVVASVLESTGYRSPDGTVEPDALTLGTVEVLAYSPTGAGY
jgi:hypothetical protein